MPENERSKFINFYVEDETRKGQEHSCMQIAISKDGKPEDWASFLLMFAKEVMLMEREACARLCEDIRAEAEKRDLRIGFFEF